jgi:hypothetical protein
MGNQGKKAVGVIVVFVFFVLVWDKACQVDVVSAGVCVLREKGCVSFAFAKLLHQGEDRKSSVVREVFLRNVV